MSNINNVGELRAEIARLKAVSEEQEKLLRNDLVQMKEDLKPVNLVANAFTSITGIKLDKGSIIKDGLGVAVSLLLSRYVLKTERKIESKLIEYLWQLVDKIKQFTMSFRERKEEEDDAPQ